MKRKNLDRDQRVWEEINMSYHFLLDLALILLSTKILGLIAQKFQMPQVVGALIAGLLLSPAGLGLLSETEFTKQLSELGVIVLMFSAGMGTDINELKHSGKAGFMVAVLGVIVPFLMGTALAWGADELGLIESTGFIENIFIGTILTATSVSITVETLKEMKKLETKVGNTILAAALIDDVLGLIALTLVCSLAGGDESIGMVLLKIVGFFVFAFVVGFGANRIFCWMLKRQHGWASHRNSVFAFVLCLVMAYCAEKFFGVADITGAYAAGLAVACTLGEIDAVGVEEFVLAPLFDLLVAARALRLLGLVAILCVARGRISAEKATQEREGRGLAVLVLVIGVRIVGVGQTFEVFHAAEGAHHFIGDIVKVLIRDAHAAHHLVHLRQSKIFRALEAKSFVDVLPVFLTGDEHNGDILFTSGTKLRLHSISSLG